MVWLPSYFHQGDAAECGQVWQVQDPGYLWSEGRELVTGRLGWCPAGFGYGENAVVVGDGESALA
jgi:hypothetical protein